MYIYIFCKWRPSTAGFAEQNGRNTELGGQSSFCLKAALLNKKNQCNDLYREDVPLRHIQQMLGHENISTTSGFYAFDTLDVFAKAMEAVNPDSGVKSWSDPNILERLYRL